MARIKNGTTFNRIGAVTPGYPETNSASVKIVTTGQGNTTYAAGNETWIVNSEFFNEHYRAGKSSSAKVVKLAGPKRTKGPRPVRKPAKVSKHSKPRGRKAILFVGA